MSLFVASAASVSLANACGGKALVDGEGSSSSGASGSSGTSNKPYTPGTSSSGASGTTSSSGISGPDCYPFQTKTYPVDSSQCRPQLATTTGCNDSVCQWSVEIPCDDIDASTGVDAGDPPDAGDGYDVDCSPCDLYAPAGRGKTSVCFGRTDDAGVKRITCSGCGVGRPPRGFVAERVSAPSLEGERLAEMAQLEAASVHAFDALYTDLARHGAPVDLLREVRASAADEVRHARAMKRVATRFGATVPDVSRLPSRERSIEELAIENAEEGCVNETYGAALALVQAESATDLRFRAMMKSIAQDELRHAALSWQIAEWLDARLDARARARVAAARERAVAQLEESLVDVCDASGVPRIGLPSGPIAREIFGAMRAHLASGALPAVA